MNCGSDYHRYESHPSLFCPTFSVRSAVCRANPSAYKAEFLVGRRSPTVGSIFDRTGGILLWIAAGRYSGYLASPSMPHPDEGDITGQEAFEELVLIVGRVCQRSMLNAAVVS